VSQYDGKYLVGGDFQTMDGLTHARIVRLNASGSIDSSFAAGANDTVRAILPLSDGSIWIAGDFTIVNGETRNHIALLASDGGVALAPQLDVNGSVFSLALQNNGRAVFAGAFTTVNGVPRNNIARTNRAFGVDSSFNPDVNGPIYALSHQPADGKLIIGGGFTQAGNQAAARLARLNEDGGLDTGFNVSASGLVYSTVLQADGRLIVGGAFSTINGTARTRIARLGTTGILDPDFHPAVSAGTGVTGLSLHSDGKLSIAGGFTTIDGMPRDGFARMGQPDAALQSLTVEGTRAHWMRAGSMPELAGNPSIEISLNGITFTDAGPMLRIAESWQSNDLTLPAPGETYYLRVRAPVASGFTNGSRGWVQSVGLFASGASAGTLFGNGFE